MAGPVLRHRIIPNYNALGEGIESDIIVRKLIDGSAQPARAQVRLPEREVAMVK
jgi:hypothetical protein